MWRGNVEKFMTVPLSERLVPKLTIRMFNWSLVEHMRANRAKGATKKRNLLRPRCRETLFRLMKFTSNECFAGRFGQSLCQSICRYPGLYKEDYKQAGIPRT